MTAADTETRDGKARRARRTSADRLSDVAWRAGIDPGPRQRQQHDGMILENMPREEGRGLRVRVTTQRPLDRYAQRGEITADQYRAGEKLRADFQSAGLQPRIIMHYAPRLPPSRDGAEDLRGHAARRRLYAAVDSVGRLGEGVLWHVCCVGETAGDWAHRHGRGARDGIVLLRAALDELDRFYSQPHRPATPPRISADAAAKARRAPAGPQREQQGGAAER